MAPAAIESLAFCIQAVRINVIEIVYITRQIIAAMTLEAEIIFPMALRAPLALKSSPITMLMPPFARMNIRKYKMVPVAESTAIIRFHAVMTGKALAHDRHVLLRRFPAGGNGAVAGGTIQFAVKMNFVAENNGPFRMRRRQRIPGIAVTRAAVPFGFYLMAAPADFH